MLALKIEMTGVVAFMLAGATISVLGKKMPSLWLAMPLLALFFGGLVSMVGGFLWWVWA